MRRYSTVCDYDFITLKYFLDGYKQNGSYPPLLPVATSWHYLFI